MSGLVDMIFGGGDDKTTTVVNSTAPMSQEEKELLALNKQLAEKQLANIDALAPFQKQFIDMAMADLNRTARSNAALDAAVTPEQQAAAAKAEFERAQRLGPIQDELMQLQLDQLRQGGKATPEQLAQIKAATDAGIEAGSSDIDAATSRGIGLIADELANSRGLRLSDSPISSEAALLAREGAIQKGSLVKNLRAGQASAALNFPLAAQQIQSGINTGQQNLNSAAQNFQAQLRQQAYQNRLALTGQAQSGGIGLASIGGGNGALSALSANRLANTTSTTTSPAAGMSHGGLGQAASGAAALWTAFSDRRLKLDYGKVGKTRTGIDLHLYKYRGEPEAAPVRIGPMADEVEKVNPEAVRMHSSGYKVVDMRGIGL